MDNRQNYVVVKSTKSTGVAILLTLVLGPIGLFYASVTGGLVMTLIPFLFAFLFLFGIIGGAGSLVLSSLTLLVFFGLASWLICIIWAVVAVRKFNEELLENASFPFADINTSPLQSENLNSIKSDENK
jgi:hypothetical protein